MKIDGDCPHCKEKVSIDIDKLEVKQPKPLDNASSQTQQTQQLEKEVIEKEVIKEVTKLPKTQPNYKCKDGRCGNVHPNPDYTMAPTKKCENCGQFGEGDLCLFCGRNEFEEIDIEELEDLGIKTPEISHEGHDHE